MHWIDLLFPIRYFKLYICLNVYSLNFRYDDAYTLVMSYTDGRTNETRSAKVKKSVASFFDENGYACADIFEPEVMKLHSSLASEKKVNWVPECLVLLLSVCCMEYLLTGVCVHGHAYKCSVCFIWWKDFRATVCSSWHISWVFLGFVQQGTSALQFSDKFNLFLMIGMLKFWF